MLPVVERGLRGANAVMDLAGRAYPTRYVNLAHFELDGIRIPHFVHRYNAYHPPLRMTERTIELALADIYLRMRGTHDVAEIGAVTPYYWQGRIDQIVDPTDTHHRVTHHQSWADWSGSGEAILSISTFEHIGAGEYGLPANPEESRAAIAKLIDHHESFLVTYPAGYNPALDRHVEDADRTQPGWRILVWHRGTRGNDWRQIGFDELTPRARTYGPAWANTLVALYRGPEDIWQRGAEGEPSRPAAS